MGTVGGAECVIHVNIAENGEFFGEINITLLLFLVKTKVFKKEHVAGFQAG